ncbi:MAG: two-component system, cell cycle sensor histidine kinase and response regulator CckA [Baekduia sp.]|nr:two-component system, cell cycle sensor histidine kinase and response regulator CckA [Baekduia sp.]
MRDSAETVPSEMERLLADAERLALLGSWAMDLHTGEAAWSDGLYRIHGLEPKSAPGSLELLLSCVHAEDRASVTELLGIVTERPEDIPAEGIDAEYRVAQPDGSLRDIRAIGRVERDATGEPARWVGAAQDITELRLSERELDAHYAVGQALRDWETFDESIVGLLARLGAALENEAGALWTWDSRRERLVCRAFWSAQGGDPSSFELASRTTEFAAGEGVPGRAYARGRPIVCADVEGEMSLTRPDAARALGVVSGVAFPAMDGGRPLAIFTFYSRDRRAPSVRLERTLTGIGRELGRFLLRHRAQLEDRQLSARELQILRLATEGRSGPAIAEHLILSPSTVKSHFEHIYEKLGVSDRAAAVALALRTGIID